MFCSIEIHSVGSYIVINFKDTDRQTTITNNSFGRIGNNARNNSQNIFNVQIYSQVKSYF